MWMVASTSNACFWVRCLLPWHRMSTNCMSTNSTGSVGAMFLCNGRLFDLYCSVAARWHLVDYTKLILTFLTFVTFPLTKANYSKLPSFYSAKASELRRLLERISLPATLAFLSRPIPSRSRASRHRLPTNGRESEFAAVDLNIFYSMVYLSSFVH